MIGLKGKRVRLIFPPHCKPLTCAEVVITGTSDGSIGGATAAALGHGKPKTIFLAGRNPAKAASVIQEIQKTDSKVKVIFIELDLADQDSVRRAAQEVLDSGEAETIDALMNNAGILCTMPFTKSKQGIELQFATVKLNASRLRERD